MLGERFLITAVWRFMQDSEQTCERRLPAVLPAIAVEDSQTGAAGPPVLLYRRGRNSFRYTHKAAYYGRPSVASACGFVFSSLVGPATIRTIRFAVRLLETA